MPDINQNKPEKATKKPAKKPKKPDARKIYPEVLLGLRFDDLEGWLKAYRSYNPQLVARAMILAFRRRYFMSQKSAAQKLGVSLSALNAWENGHRKIRWKSQHDLVCAGWFKPQHFGIDVESAEFSEQSYGE